MILLVCAVAKELAWFEPSPDIEVLVSGVGMIEAASSVARKLACAKFDVVVNAGVAGAMPGVARVGDGVVVVEEFVELDIEDGRPIALPNGERVIDRTTGNAELAAPSFKRARGITVSRVTSTDRTAERLRALGAEVESMEGFAVLRAAKLAAVPAIEVRGISNLIGDRDKSQWNFASGIDGLQRVLRATLERIA